MEIFVGNTVKLVLRAYLDMSTYSTRQIRFKKPSGVTGLWDATLETDNLMLSYTTEPEDLDETGEWAVQIHVEESGAVLDGRWANFHVLPHIADPVTP